MAVTDPYKTLGVGRKANADEIKKAYRKLARENHPDKNPGNEQAEERFKKVQEAYGILSDADKRKQFDSAGAFNGMRGRPGGGAGGYSSGGFGNFGDVFSDILGGAGRGGRPRPQRGNDLEIDVRIAFDQAVNGAQIPVAVPVTTDCPTCHGSGAAPGTSPKACPNCGGRGVETQGQGMFSIQHACHVCGGSGSVIEKPCGTCRGSGAARSVKKLRVNIPPGVREGSRVRLAGKGERGENGGPAGDLYVVTRVEESPIFKRKGENFEVEVPVTVPEAMLGATIEVPTLDSTKKIKIGPGTKHGTLKRIKGEGPPRLKGKGRGDIHYRVLIDLPEKLNKEQREAVEDLASVLDGDPREQLNKVVNK